MAIIATYCHLSPPDATALGASNPVTSPKFCPGGEGRARARGTRVPKFVVTKSSRSESHLALGLQNLHAFANFRGGTCPSAPCLGTPLFKSELQVNPLPFHLESLWGATLMPHTGCAMDWHKTKYWWWVKTPVQFYAACGPEFMKFWGNVGDPLYFPAHLPGCLRHVSFSRYSPLSPEVVEKPNKCKGFWPSISSGGTTPDFSTALC